MLLSPLRSWTCSCGTHYTVNFGYILCPRGWHPLLGIFSKMAPWLSHLKIVPEIQQLLWVRQSWVWWLQTAVSCCIPGDETGFLLSYKALESSPRSIPKTSPGKTGWLSSGIGKVTFQEWRLKSRDLGAPRANFLLHRFSKDWHSEQHQVC